MIFHKHKFVLTAISETELGQNDRFMQLHNNILKSYLHSSEILQITGEVCISYFHSNKYHNFYTVQKCHFFLINSKIYGIFKMPKLAC